MRVREGALQQRLLQAAIECAAVVDHLHEHGDVELALHVSVGDVERGVIKAHIVQASPALRQ
eukprot:11640341-Heterocapsa_arctica.AAC.1